MDAMLSGLAAAGWWATSLGERPVDICAMTTRVQILAASLGEVVHGRNRQQVEHVIPRTAETAYAGSLSTTYGLGSIPIHTDTAHWPVPCRYLVIGCVDPGP